MFLHAHTLQFARPGSGETFTITAPLSEELQTVLNKLEEATAKKRAGTQESE